MGRAIMFKNVMIPVQIKRIKDPNGREKIKAVVPMNIMFEKDFDAGWLEKELVKFEKRYFKMVKNLKKVQKMIHSNKQKKGRVLLYWGFGDNIVKFIEQYKNSSLWGECLTNSLVRDVGVSEKVILRCKRFRLLYPDVAMIDPDRSFNSYVATFEGGYISDSRQRKGKMK
jgi:hypothetical protein